MVDQKGADLLAVNDPSRTVAALEQDQLNGGIQSVQFGGGSQAGKATANDGHAAGRCIAQTI